MAQTDTADRMTCSAPATPAESHPLDKQLTEALDAMTEAAGRLKVARRILCDHQCPATGAEAPEGDEDMGGWDLSVLLDVIDDVRALLLERAGAETEP